jgi:hypothetical protein
LSGEEVKVNKKQLQLGINLKFQYYLLKPNEWKLSSKLSKLSSELLLKAKLKVCLNEFLFLVFKICFIKVF